ncbi:alpha-mannosidase [Cellulomonas wangsupingiae]|uniref:alpha-mannosidase n=1 Tax=Cellulomonas wangsupingiae TaxID=2968085 RepID=UPI001D0E29B7|nr:alpha-mannosidase [Cellulomonas wangsupingiae]MCM0639516.1 alpha-mannosidase [Cellulomonas wangsupingiae]
MRDLKVDDAGVASFAAAVDAHAGPVGAECTATGQALGSGAVQDALGNVSLVLTVLDQALAEGAGALARDARSSGQAWRSADSRLAMRAV